MGSRALSLLLVLSAVKAAEIPVGTRIEIRLTTTVKTSSSKVNDPVEAVVIAPVRVANRDALAAGTKVHGAIKEVTQAAKPEDQAVVHIQFDGLVSPRGARATIAARVVDVDNARESVDDQGRIVGIVASKTASGRMDTQIEKVTEKHPILGEILNTAKGALIKETDANIDYDPGVEITIELTKPAAWSESVAGPNVRSVEPAAGLAALVNQEPMRTQAAQPPRPSDTTNVIFIGSREQIEAAFQEAGWSTAEELSRKSKLETVRAVLESRGYKEAPVSVLFLDGRPPDMVYQKQNDTFAKRHHIRIWQRPGSFNGKEIWVCASTHDIAIDFSERDHSFIHKVDSEIDRERAKVVSDLVFTGKVQALSLVDRAGSLKAGENATGDAFHTDGRVAVLQF